MWVGGICARRTGRQCRQWPRCRAQNRQQERAVSRCTSRLLLARGGVACVSMVSSNTKKLLLLPASRSWDLRSPPTPRRYYLDLLLKGPQAAQPQRARPPEGDLFGALHERAARASFELAYNILQHLMAVNPGHRVVGFFSLVQMSCAPHGFQSKREKERKRERERDSVAQEGI